MRTSRSAEGGHDAAVPPGMTALGHLTSVCRDHAPEYLTMLVKHTHDFRSVDANGRRFIQWAVRQVPAAPPSCSAMMGTLLLQNPHSSSCHACKQTCKRMHLNHQCRKHAQRDFQWRHVYSLTHVHVQVRALFGSGPGAAVQ
jgi:hypothetical protein